MAFIRVKQVKNNVYCYIVENKWIKGKKTPKQKVKKYLGRVYMYYDNKKDFYRIMNIQDSAKYMKENAKAVIISDLIRAELLRKGFIDKKNKLIQDKVSYLPDKNVFLVKGREKNISIASNHGFLHEWTIKRILDFKKKGNKRNSGLLLAKYFVEAGIAVPREVFVVVFEKS